MKLLLVDDEVFSVEALQNAIDWPSLGITELYTCYDVEDAKEILSGETIDMMICDIEMPSGSGLDLLKWIEEEKLPVVSILLTCHPDFSYAMEAIRCKAFAYLLKPFRPEEVSRTVSDARMEVARLRKDDQLRRQLKSIRANRQFIREQFWHQIVVGSYTGCDSSYMEAEAAWRNIAFSEKQKYLPCLFIITREPDHTMNDGLLIFSLRNVLSELFCVAEEDPPMITIARKRFLLLLPADQNLTEEQREHCEYVQNLFARYYQLQIQYFTGSPVLYTDLASQLTALNNMADTLLQNLTGQEDSLVSPVQKSMQLIREDPSLSRDALAAAVGLHPDYLTKLFKKETGKSLSDYVADVKIEEAKYLLSQSANTVSAIASLLDYANFSYFSKMFRKKTGCTPSEYRKRYYGSSPE